MLLTLFKKDFKENASYFTPIILMVLVLGILLNFPDLLGSSDSYFDEMKTPVIFQASWLLSIATFVCIFIFSGLAIVRSLYNSIYNEKGYELFTLPISSGQIMFSKVLSVIVWLVVVYSFYYLTLSVFQLIVSNDNFYTVSDIMSEKFKYMFSNLRNMFYMIFSYINRILYLIVMSLTVIFAGALANSSLVQKYRGAIAMIIITIVYFGIEYIERSMFDIYLYDLFYSNFVYNTVADADLLYITAFRLAFIVLLFIGTKILWERKLQLTY